MGPRTWGSLAGSYTAVALGRIPVHNVLDDARSKVKLYGFSLGAQQPVAAMVYADKICTVVPDTYSAQSTLSIV